MGNPPGVKRDFNALEQRRFEALKLLAKGVHQAEVARRLGVHRQSVSRWAKAIARKGKPGLRKTGRAGRLPRLTERQRARLKAALLKSPCVHGNPAHLWSLAQVAKLIKKQTGEQYTISHVLKILRKLGLNAFQPVGRPRARRSCDLSPEKKCRGCP
jgi:transposase